MISHPDSSGDTFAVGTMDQGSAAGSGVDSFQPRVLDCGDLSADVFTVALDAVTPEIFERIRGRGVDSPHKWGNVLAHAQMGRGNPRAEKFSAHLIGAMGKTGEEILEVARKIRDMGGYGHRFAFFPERGSLMEDWASVPRDPWRRVPLARFLIGYAGGHISRMRFDAAGRLIDYGMDHDYVGGTGRFRETVSDFRRPWT